MNSAYGAPPIEHRITAHSGATTTYRSNSFTPPPRRNITDIDPPQEPTTSLNNAYGASPIQRPITDYVERSHPVFNQQPDGTHTLDNSRPQNEFDLLNDYHIKNARDFLSKLPDKTISKITKGTETVEESIEQHKYSRLTDMAYQYAYKQDGAFEDIQEDGAKYIKDFGDFEVLKGLSGDGMTGTVFRNKTTGEVVVVHRGSDTAPLEFVSNPKQYLKNIATRTGEGFGKNLFRGKVNTDPLREGLLDATRLKNAEDWWVNAKTVVGKEQNTRQYKKSLELVNNVSEALGIDKADIINAGHSKGGGQARYVAEKLGSKNSYIFDAADSPFVDHHQKNVSKDVKIKSFFTEGSVVSTGAHTKKNSPEHYEKTKVRPAPGMETSQVKRHTLERNYYSNEPKINENGNIEATKVSAHRSAIGLGTEVSKTTAGLAPGVAELMYHIEGQNAPDALHYGNEIVGTAFAGKDTPVMEMADASARDITYFMDRTGITSALTTNERKKENAEIARANAIRESVNKRSAKADKDGWDFSKSQANPYPLFSEKSKAWNKALTDYRNGRADKYGKPVKKVSSVGKPPHTREGIRLHDKRARGGASRFNYRYRQQQEQAAYASGNATAMEAFGGF